MRLYIINEVTIQTLPHLKCIRLVSVRSSLPCINIRRANSTNLFLYNAMEDSRSVNKVRYCSTKVYWVGLSIIILKVGLTYCTSNTASRNYANLWRKHAFLRYTLTKIRSTALPKSLQYFQEDMRNKIPFSLETRKFTGIWLFSAWSNYTVDTIPCLK